MDTSLLRQRILGRLRDRAALEASLLKVRGPLIKGWLHERTTSCQRGQCKCMRGEKHGPFLYASVKIGKRVVQRYAGKVSDEVLVNRIRDYGMFRESLHGLRKVQQQMDRDWKQLERGLMKSTVR